jgi:hypothetical protein
MAMTDRASIEHALELLDSQRGYGGSENPLTWNVETDNEIIDAARAHLSCLDPSPEMVERAAKAMHEVQGPWHPEFDFCNCRQNTMIAFQTIQGGSG